MADQPQQQNDTSALWTHIGDLHKKHGELAAKMASGGGNAPVAPAAPEHGDELQKHTEILSQLLEALKENTAALKAKGGKER